MRPGFIPDELIWPGGKRKVIGPPKDHDQALMEILPVEAIVDMAAPGIPRFHFKIDVDAMDLDHLRRRGWFWLVFYGGVMPFDVAHPEVEDMMDVEGTSS